MEWRVQRCRCISKPHGQKILPVGSISGVYRSRKCSIPSLDGVQLLSHLAQLLSHVVQLLKDQVQLKLDSDGGHVGDESNFGGCAYEVLAECNEIRLLGSHCCI
jgi:hypothetical protein